MAMTPLPETLGEDLNEIKTLIDERETQRAVHQSNIATEREAMDVIDKETKMLRDHASIVLGVKADRSEGKSKKGEDNPPRTADETQVEPAPPTQE